MIKKFEVGKYYRINKELEEKIKNMLILEYNTRSLCYNILNLIKKPKKCIEVGVFTCCCILQDVNLNKKHETLCFKDFLCFIDECKPIEFIQEEFEV